MKYNIVESGMRIRKLRKQHGLTQEQLAEQMCITANNLSRIERGLYGLSIESMAELAASFGVTLDYLALGRESKLDTVKTMLRTMADGLIDLVEKL